ncbi:hypothetical protein ACM26V_03610 [Salipaludibacillus sp. HK11]|uniref:hypothetical protein n=1 Tax=Salipaludibacillus sp. HK11 TaxID=3394320 RepID=UPI0039FD04C0
MSIANTTYAEETTNDMIEEKIDKLHDEKIKLLLNEELSDREIATAFKEIDNKLELLGVEFLSSEEVMEQFGISEVHLMNEPGFTTMVAVPKQDNVT